MQIVKIEGMSCKHCVQAVTEALQKLDGLENIKVSLDNSSASFENTKNIDEQTIKNAIIQIGFIA